VLAAGPTLVVAATLLTPAAGFDRVAGEGPRVGEGRTLTYSVDVERALRQHGIEAVLHCAARSLVGQSMQEPALYYGQNVVGGIALLEGMRAAGVDRIVFSSSAAVYGAPDETPIP